MATMRSERRGTRLLLQEEVPTREAIVRVLEQAGIDMVFGLPGGYTLPLFNALYDHQRTIQTVLVREESRAGVIAVVYGRLTGRPGVAIGQDALILSTGLGLIDAPLSTSSLVLLPSRSL